MADDILKEAIEAFGEAESHESDNRKTALDDLRFARLGGEYQWPGEVMKQRKADGRPCLTINKMPAFIRQVVNDSRQNKPAISVHPVEDADVKTADVMSGLIRQIETQSNADVAYDTAVDNSATMGFGYIRINIDYACDDTFDKDIVIRPVPNPFAVYGDPYSQGADSSDWMTSFVVEQMSEAQFKRRFPKAQVADFGFGSWADGWCDQTAKKARVAEYWKREEVSRQLVQYQVEGVPDIRMGYEDELDQIQAQFGSIELIPDAKRAVKTYRVKQYVITANEVLESKDWAGRYIPIIPVYGEEVNVEGKRYFRSLIRDARDPQQMFNFWRTAATELVALAPKAPYIGKKGAFKYDPRWATANNATHAFLEYEGDQPPQRQPFTGVPVGDLQMAMNASDDMKAVIGMYDASLGARSNETSGRAIMARQREGDISTFHFIDNLSRAIRHTGKILIDLIPKVYNSERVIRVMGEDRKSQAVKLTDGAADPDHDIYNLTVGKYDLTVKAGPSYTSRREEAATMLTELVRAQPDAAVVLGDLIVENMDIPGGDKAVKRLQAMLPDQIKQAESGDNPEVAAAMQQVQQITQQAQQAIQELSAKLQDAEDSKDIDARKVAVDEYKAETERMKAASEAIPMEILPTLMAQMLQQMLAGPQELPPEQSPMENMGAPGPMQPGPEMGMGQAEGQF